MISGIGEEKGAPGEQSPKQLAQDQRRIPGSDWSSSDTVAASRERPGSPFTMRIGIRLQLGLLVLGAALIGLCVVTLATWFTNHSFVVSIRY